MKIAIIYPHFTGPYGGERLVINLSKKLIEKGTDITIYTNRMANSLLSLTKGINISSGNYPQANNHQIETFMDLAEMPFLITRINKRPDIVMPIGWQSVFGAYLYKKFINKKIKIIYYCLEPPRFIYDLRFETLKNSGYLKKKVIKAIMWVVRKIDILSVKSVDKIISISEWTSEQVQNIYNRKSTIIQPGVEIERFNKYTKAEAKKKLNIPHTKIVFLSVSKLHPRKNINEAIDVFLKKQNKNSIFYIAGTGPEKYNIEKLIDKLRVKNVKLLGELTDDDVVLYMKASDYFIFTAINEPFGIAPLEAEISGCKIIPYKPKLTPNNWGITMRKIKNLIKVL